MTENYDEFVKKFKPKKTSDDCYTPENIYNVVADWVAEEYKVDKLNFVRPFYPNGDYQKYRYANNSIVVDNPPFSIFCKIVNWLVNNNIKFFLFAPSLTALSKNLSTKITYISTSISIICQLPRT